MCGLCPRKCNVDRIKNLGFCNKTSKPEVARCGKHMWEEPPISGKSGSGAIFFSGCNLKCVFCQNYEISTKGFGKEISEDRLCDIMLRLQDEGACNINLVTPTHFADKIVRCLDTVKHKLFIPVVYNCGGYELSDTINMLDGYIDIYLPDFKYFDDKYALMYSRAENYFNIASNAVNLMINQVGKPIIDKNGIMKKGVIIRHMVLPSLYKDSIKILQYLDKTYEKDEFLLSLMSQYTPNGRCSDIKNLNRKITTFEYEKVADYAASHGFKGFFQEKSSACEKYTPAFDLSGV